MPRVGLEVSIIIVSLVPVGTSDLLLPGLDPEKLLARGIGTHRLESGGASRERRESLRPSLIRGGG